MTNNLVSRAAVFAAGLLLSASAFAAGGGNLQHAGTMVCCSEGSVITAMGRAAASSRATSASKNRVGGMWRRRRWPGPSAARTRPRLG